MTMMEGQIETLTKEIEEYVIDEENQRLEAIITAKEEEIVLL